MANRTYSKDILADPHIDCYVFNPGVESHIVNFSHLDHRILKNPYNKLEAVLKNPIVTALALILIASVSMWSCVQTAPATATNRSIAISGDAKLNINVPVVTFGDKVAEAATKGIDAYLQTITGPWTQAIKETAVGEGVAAGLKQAIAEGKIVTADDKKELQDKVETTVQKKAEARSK